MEDASPAAEGNGPLPRHVAVIMDGNGRWAESRALPRYKGHIAGVDSARAAIRYLNNHYHLEYLTLYGFSTENWSRSEDEVDNIFGIFEKIIDSESEELHRQGVVLRHLGCLEELPGSLQKKINEAIKLTESNRGMTLGFAFNYGGRGEIINAVSRIVADGIRPQDINEDLFGRYLYTSGMPEVDLLIRTGGELRVSNFLIWQTAYSEYYFTDVLWPDFGEKEIDKAMLSYHQRQRRFGGL